MNFSNRTEANLFYREVLQKAEKDKCVNDTMAKMGRKDLFFLLTRLLHRMDINKDWLFDRCQEVQNEPNGMLDLWAREHYKSTIITFGKSIQDILDSHSADSYYWDQEVTIGIFSHTRPIAKAFLTQIMNEFESNELLKQLYPDVLYQNPRKEAPRWSEDRGFVVKRKSNPKESTVEAWGLVDGQPTSKHFLILNYDDVVTKDSVTSPEMIKKVTDSWALSLNLGSHGGVKRHIGTRYHFNDTYATIIKRDSAKTRIHPATDTGKTDGKPVFLSQELLDEKRRDYGPYVFGCQMLQNPKADEVQGFEEDWFQYWYPKNWGDMNRYIVVDPAGSKKKSSDYTIMWVIGLAEDGNYYKIDGIRDRLNLTQRAEKLFMLHRKYRPIAVGYEQYGMQADIEHMEYMMDQETYRFNIIPLGGKTPKNDRIRMMVPIYEQGRFYQSQTLIYVDYERKTHNLTNYIINDEYLAFPVSQYDDGMDCEARILDPALGAEFPEPKEELPYSDEPYKAKTEYDIFAS